MRQLSRSCLALAAISIAACSDSVSPTGTLRASPAPRAVVIPSAFSDSFDGAALDPFWNATFEQFGTLSFTTAQAHTGSQSLAFASMSAPSSSGPNIQIGHDFAAPTKGTFSVYFYDAAPGQQTLYEQMSLSNSTRPNLLATIGTNDFDANCYMSRLDDGSGNTVGPNGNCGSFPQTQTTNVPRTLGWHQLEIDVTATGVTFSIDGQETFTANGDYSFDTIVIFVSGPFFRPLTTGYFDDFSFSPPAPVFYPFTGFFRPIDNLPVVNIVKGGSAVPIKFSLGGDLGLGILAAGSPTSTSVSCNTGAPTQIAEETVSAGGSPLSYDPATQIYTYVWKTEKSWATTCRQLNVTLTDGSVHVANFQFQ